MIRRPPRSTPLYSSAASDVYKRQQLLLAAPENVIDLSRHLGSVTEILRDKRTNRSGVLTAPVITPKPGSEGQWRSEANPVDIVLR